MNYKVRIIFLFFFVILFCACGTTENTTSEDSSRDEQIVQEGKPATQLSKHRELSKELAREEYECQELSGVDLKYDEGVSPAFNTENYDALTENEFREASKFPLSTFSIDVDKASYANVRRFLRNNRMPDKGAVRIEEMINYFSYDYTNPKGKHPFSFQVQVSTCPWNKKHDMVHIGIQGKKIDYQHIKPSNLVFLLDVSGSMNDENKLPLLKKSFKLLLNELSEKDKISLVVYAGAAGLVLPPTAASEKETILAALDKLEAGGTTAGGAGIQLAYKTAQKAFIKGGNNRIILATDGDFNVGQTSRSALTELIENERDKGIFLTILGFGMGNYNDADMEHISNVGNGNYFYIDNIKEAEKVFVKEMRANLFTIAKDVKIQIEFNPNYVKYYRLIGYENRKLEAKDFNDDKKDAGELGAGHNVTALYEIIPVGSDEKVGDIDPLKYQQAPKANNWAKNSNELMTIKFRYKPPQSSKSIKVAYPVKKNCKTTFQKTNDNYKFSAAVAAFGMLLRDSKFKGKATYDMVINMAKEAKGKDPEGYRNEFIDLVKTAKLLQD